MPLLKSIKGATQVFSQQEAQQHYPKEEAQKKKPLDQRGTHKDAPRQHQLALQAKDLMSSPVISLRPQSTIEEAQLIMMDHHIRHLPVLNEAENQIVGLLSDRDILKHLSNAKYQEVRQIMSEKVIVATPETSLRDVAGLMLSNRFGALPVVKLLDENNIQLMGIVTTRDLIKGIWNHAPIDLWA